MDDKASDISTELETDVSTTSTTSLSLGEVPDGGIVAWLQVVGSFLLFFNSWGIVNSFGAFQIYFENELLSSSSPSAISWIGSIQGFLLMVSTLYAGRIFDMGYMHTLVRVGSFMVVFGMMMTSISTEYYQVLLAQGFCVGIGSGMLFIPSMAVVTTYFREKRSFALGLSAAGSSIGGIIYPVVFHQLQPQIGFGWTIRVIGFIALGSLAISMAVMRQRTQSAEKRKIIDMDALRNGPYMLFTASLFFGFMGLYIPYFYISSYASVKTSADPQLTFYFVAIANAASTLGRTLPNFLADRLGPINMLVPCIAASAVLAFCWIPVHDVGGLAAFSVLYGFFSGSVVSLTPSVIARLCPDLKLVGTRIGMVFTFCGLGFLIGNPIAGALLDLRTGDFVHAQIFCWAVVTVALVLSVACRAAKVGFTLRIKT